MYCMKALGVVHFKGNWTNIGKQKQNKKNNKKKNPRHTAFIVPRHCWNTPPSPPPRSSMMNSPV